MTGKARGKEEEGVISAFFHCKGHVPLSIDILKRIYSGVHNS